MAANTLQVRPFDRRSVDEILDFCAQNPVQPFYPRSLLKRFITQLVSSDKLIFDIYNGPRRVAVSVLLDRVMNPSGSANLETIGWSNEVSADDLYAFAFSNLLPKRPIQIATHETAKPSGEVLEKYGFRFLYHTFEMIKTDMVVPLAEPNDGVEFERLSLRTYDEYYKVLVESFETNLETSIPPLQEMKETFRSRLETKPAGTLLLVLNGKIAGFCSAVPDEGNPKSGEVHMIGVLPEARGKGLGAVALSKAISELSSLGCESCHLTVAAQNQSALHLYKKFGFNVAQTSTSYLRS